MVGRVREFFANALDESERFRPRSGSTDGGDEATTLDDSLESVAPSRNRITRHGLRRRFRLFHEGADVLGARQSFTTFVAKILSCQAS